MTAIAKIVRLSGLVTSAGLAIAAAGGAGAQTVGVNAAVVADVRMTTQANPTMHRAVLKERVSLGNDVVTGRGAKLQILLLDKTVFTLGGNTRLKVDRFVYDPSRNASSVGTTVSRGAFRFMSGKPTRANPGQSSIRTPVASIGIRGTIVETVVGEDAVRIARAEAGLPAFSADPDLATLVLLRGPGPATQGDEHPGAIDVTVGDETISLDRPGYAVFIPGAGGPILGPFLLSDRGSMLLAGLTGSGRPAFGSSFLPGLLSPPSNPIEDLFFFDQCSSGGVVTNPGGPVTSPGGPVNGGGNGPTVNFACFSQF